MLYQYQSLKDRKCPGPDLYSPPASKITLFDEKKLQRFKDKEFHFASQFPLKRLIVSF
jgi:hypothetical protein